MPQFINCLATAPKAGAERSVSIAIDDILTIDEVDGALVNRLSTEKVAEEDDEVWTRVHLRHRRVPLFLRADERQVLVAIAFLRGTPERTVALVDDLSDTSLDIAPPPAGA